MDTLGFLSKILPREGIYYACVAGPGKQFRHIPCYSVEELVAEFTQRRDTDGETLYHANATFKNESVVTREGKTEWRVAENQHLLRSFYLDIDTGPEKDYPNKKAAAAGVVSFCSAVQLPLPMMVSSGNGLHCYWVLTEDVLPSEWLPVAFMLAAAAAHEDFRVDRTATIDARRVLRPVGSINRKPNKPSREVTLVSDQPEVSLDFFESQLEAYIKSNSVNVIVKDSYNADLNTALTGHIGPSIPSYAETIAEHCQQIAKMRDTQGDVSFDVWRAVAGTLKHCEDGVEFAVKWTERRAETGHAQTDVEAEMGKWGAGPATCTHFELHNPEGCEGCPQKGKQKSPITLGYRELMQEESEQTVIKDGREVVEIIPEFPRGYSFVNNLMCRSIEIEDRVVVTPFSTTLFYPRARFQKEDSKWALSIRSHMPREGIKDFDIDQASLAAQADMLKSLAANQIVTTHQKSAGANMNAYLKDWLEKLKVETDEQRTYLHFGWQENEHSFLIGNRLYSKNVPPKDVILSHRTKSKLVNFPEQLGSVEVWSQAIDAMYNIPGEEYRQYAIASSFGCALTPMSAEENYCGVLFAITGGQTSKGKTTVSHSALSVWGNPKKLYYSSEDGLTDNALYATLGTYQNVPILLDEYTHIGADAFSKLCYAVSSGVEKSRMTVGKGTGVGFADVASWAVTPFITANKPLHALLSTRGNSEAEAVRLIETHIDEHVMRDVDKMLWQDYTRDVQANYGTAGAVFAQYIVDNRSEVNQLMNKWMRRLVDDVSDRKYRFYRGHAECTMAAVEIANKLGILNFNVEKLYTYAVQLFKRLARDVEDQNSTTTEDAISAMINALSPGIAVTDYYKDLRADSLPELVRLSGEWTGRVIRGSKGNSEPLAGRLYLSMQAVRKWCAENRVGYNEMVIECKRLSLWIPLGEGKFVLGRGTNQTTGQSRCICLNYTTLQGLYDFSFVKDTAPPVRKTPDSYDQRPMASNE